MTLSPEKQHIYTPGRPDRADSDPVAVARGLADKWRATAVERDRVGGSATVEREDLRASGLLSLLIPREYGGWGADWPTAVEVVRAIATVDGSLGHLFGYHLSSAPMIEMIGSPEQEQRLYRQIAENDWWTGNASSENNSHVLDWKVSATPTQDGGYILNGTKHFCSGAKGSDLLFVFAVVQEDSAQQGAIIAAAIPTSRVGIRTNDDWAAIGMRQTDSGSTDFDNVKVEADEVLGAPNAFILAFIQSERGSLFAPIVQLIFANVYLGIAHGALDVAREYTRTQARPWTPAGVQQATEDPYTIRSYGEFTIALQGADAAAREAARLLQTVWDKGDALTPEDRGELMVKVSGVKALATNAALSVNSGIFEVIGARGTNPKYGYDRFWRNVRTHTLHDPVAYKIADVGKHTLNGQYPIPGFTS
ncbi:acyl-CoA dehydrogenase family protein [Tsukamurella paurometabola]|uniref:Dibenzothiophene monooxygenase n=1 Tax=Tsukamurella paurometabola TaxID=2061 RepID=A0ABS5NER2_TSUPA|nr:acyl-CoA dehydrogenase family protein [Tsukamurella paurometabola]MBS4102752.1 acyl-CoA dehydrogenase family protein [Tsukamurella paurometabola]